VMCTYRIFLWITWWKNFENRSTFAKHQTLQTAHFSGTWCRKQSSRKKSKQHI